jgi:hypothetical protein
MSIYKPGFGAQMTPAVDQPDDSRTCALCGETDPSANKIIINPGNQQQYFQMLETDMI